MYKNPTRSGHINAVAIIEKVAVTLPRRLSYCAPKAENVLSSQQIHPLFTTQFWSAA